MRKPVGLSLEALSSLVDDVHEAGASGGGWLGVARRIGGLLNSQSVSLIVQGEAGQLLNIEMVSNPQPIREYAAYYGRLDALRPAVMGAPNDMHDCLMTRLFDESGVDGYLVVTRSARADAFESPDIRLLSLLAPHLRRAMRIRLFPAPASVGPDSALEVLDRLSGGALIVDAEARVAHANRAAEAILAKADGLGVERDCGAPRLRAASPEQTRALRRLIWNAAMSRRDAPAGAGGALRLASATSGFLLASVSPLRAGLAWDAARRPAALVLTSAPDQDAAPSPEHLRALFGLTPAEAAVAGRIMRGDGTKAAARALRVAPNTVRTHLSRIFEKTETHRQAELVRLLQQVARLGEP